MPSLRALLILGCGLSVAVTTQAETFVGPTTSSNRLMVARNEAIVINRTLSPMYSDGPSCNLIISNVIYALPYRHVSAPPYPVEIGVSGPAELVFTNPCVVGFTRLRDSSMRLLLWPTNDTNSISVYVPKGKSIQFFAGGVDWEFVLYPRISAGGTSFESILYVGGVYEGPMTLTFDTHRYDFFAFPLFMASYWFVEDVYRNPNAVVFGEPGARGILVEKSSDLQNWFPVGTVQSTIGSNSFYRLQVLR